MGGGGTISTPGLEQDPNRSPAKPGFFAYPLNKGAHNMEKGVVAMVFSKGVRHALVLVPCCMWDCKWEWRTMMVVVTICAKLVLDKFVCAALTPHPL